MDESSNISWVIERARIIDVIVGFANAMDAQDWQKLRTSLADEVDVDYAAFRGEAPRRVTASEYVKQRVDALAGLLTLHISTNHEVTILGDCASCKSAYRIYRLDPRRESGQSRLDTAGNYIHQLVLADGSWLINGIKQTVVLQSGERQVHGALRNPP